MRFIKSFFANVLFKIMNSHEFMMLNVSLLYRYDFKYLGKHTSIQNPYIIKNAKYICIGDNFSSMHNLRIEAWDEYMGEKFEPQIIIGNNVNINTDCHIGCINKIIIGNDVLLASKIYISDHSHGEINNDLLIVAPVRRRLYSKGPVIIEDKVWIGENVSILPGVTIGESAIIGANSVVTKNVPSRAIVAGNPARIIKQF